MASEAALLRAMNLTEQDKINDAVLTDRKSFPERLTFQTEVLKSSLCDDRPVGPDLWAVAKPVDYTVPICHMLVPIALVSATIPGGGKDGSPQEIPKEHILAKSQGAEWGLENISYSPAQEKIYKQVNVASPPTVYSINNYHKHVPVQVRNAIPTFKDKFLNKHTSTYKLLKKEIIAVTFVTFKCNFELRSKEDVDDHFEDVHGIEGGATRLLPFREIAVNESIPFEVPKLADIENYGQDKKIEVIRALYITCQARGVVNKTNNRNEACLNESRSKEFMNELSKSCSSLFHGRVKKYIKEQIKKDISESFSCKWSTIEAALYNAVGREQNITKVYNFIDKDGTDFNSYPLEILFDQIDDYVDNVAGKDTSSFVDTKHRTVSDYTFTTKSKYILIMRLVRSLSGELKFVEDHIQQAAADILSDIKL